MTVSEPLIMYSRADCHLCDQVIIMMDRARIAWRPVNIDSNPALVQKYGVRVPVLQHPESGKELFFPFSDRDLFRFLEGER